MKADHDIGLNVASHFALPLPEAVSKHLPQSRLAAQAAAMRQAISIAICAA
ncbi:MULTISPECIES: hypothetical protein [unclassified Methylobacterium]|uniref:hypothetical protein n=1 Tax=unclassified Methylobacterium TaxID=2615210 RepID=UPI000AA35007|nr:MULTISPECIES: hypothetical protein [unclassified Methylobacterium]